MKFPFKIKQFRDLKLNIKFTILIITSLAISIGVFAAVFFFVIEQNVIEESEDYVRYTEQRSIVSMDNSIDSVNMATQFFLNDEEMKNILIAASEGEEIDTRTWLEFKKNNIADLERLVNSNPILHGMRVYSTTDNVQEMMPILYTKSRMQRQDWSKKQGYIGWNFGYTDNVFSSYMLDQDETIASLVTFIKNQSDEPVGVIEATIRMDEMFTCLYEDIDTEWGCFVTAEGDYLTGHDEAKNAAVLEEVMPEFKESTGEDIQTSYIKIGKNYYMVAFSRVKELGGELVFIRDITESVSHVYNIRNVFVAIMILFLTFLAFGINGIVHILLKPLYEIIDVIQTVQGGNLDARITKQSQDEMGNLTDQLNEMLDKVQALMQDNLNRELLAKNSEIKALQNQINAHFIYNVLETIKMMAEIDEKYEIADAITSLGKLLRYSMRWAKGTVRVEEELEYIKNYVVLVNLRFDYKILLSLNLSEDVKRQVIPKMSLQPIVENAILHGIEDLAEDTTIYIKGYSKDDDTFIEITDGGKGMTPEQIKSIEGELAGSIKPDNTSKSNGIGLKNVQDRIAIFFGEGYGISFASKEGLYTKVTLRIPRKTNDDLAINGSNIK